MYQERQVSGHTLRCVEVVGKGNDHFHDFMRAAAG